MELYAEILKHILEKEEIHVTFPNLDVNTEKLVETASYQALMEIKQVLEDDTLSDEACFQKIEEIVCIFERLGSSGGNRHDFA